MKMAVFFDALGRPCHKWKKWLLNIGWWLWFHLCVFLHFTSKFPGLCKGRKNRPANFHESNFQKHLQRLTKGILWRCQEQLLVTWWYLGHVEWVLLFLPYFTSLIFKEVELGGQTKLTLHTPNVIKNSFWGMQREFCLSSPIFLP